MKENDYSTIVDLEDEGEEYKDLQILRFISKKDDYIEVDAKFSDLLI